MTFKTSCPYCNGHIEFDAEHAGRTSNCPHCNGEIILTGPDPGELAQVETESAAPWNILSSFFHGSDSKALEQSLQASERQKRIASTMELIRNGTWQVPATNIVLSTGERALWRQTGALVDPSLFKTGETRGASVVTTRIFKSITTRLTRPPSEVARTQPTTSSIRGEMILTTARLVFASRLKTFITRYENLADVTSAIEGIKFSERGRSVLYAIKYDQPNGDIITPILQYGLQSAGGQPGAAS